MQCCKRCGNTHVGMLILGSPMFMLLFQQAFEQWCDMKLSDQELAEIRWLPIEKVNYKTDSLQSFLGFANSINL